MNERKLINAKGQPSYGVFDDPIEMINHMDFDLRNAMDRKLSNWAKKFKFNQFQFIGLINPELIVGIAIVDLKLVSNSFIYIYETSTGKFEEFSFLNPFASNTQMDLRPNDGESHFKKGRNTVEFKATSTPGVRSVKVELDGKLSVDALIDESTEYNPLSMCSRAGYTGWVFTQKTNALICTGSVKWQDKEYDLKAMNTLASVDWSCGYMRRETFWNWGSLSCFLPDGRRLGFNLAAGVNETGTSENAIWLDGKMHKVDMVDFKFDRYHPEHAWTLRSNDGKVDIHFEPAGQRKEKLNAFVMASNFTQHFGKYFGDITLDGETIHLSGEWGFSEDHYAKW